MGLPGRAWHVGTVLWYLAGLTKSRTVKMQYTAARDAGLDRHAVRRGLVQLEKAGLIQVKRGRGRSPVVTIVAAKLDQ